MLRNVAWTSTVGYHIRRREMICPARRSIICRYCSYNRSGELNYCAGCRLDLLLVAEELLLLHRLRWTGCLPMPNEAAAADDGLGGHRRSCDTGGEVPP
jgi:hypothetical protein